MFAPAKKWGISGGISPDLSSRKPNYMKNKKNIYGMGIALPVPVENYSFEHPPRGPWS
jgi:hypothetical protein